MGTVLRIGPDTIVTLDEFSYFVEIEKCDRTLFIPLQWHGGVTKKRI